MRPSLKPLRICLVSKEYPPEGRGGIAKYVQLLAHGLVEQGHDVTVIAGPAANGSSSPSTSPPAMHGPKLNRVENRRLALPPPLRRKARGIWNQLERSWAVDREIARLERTQGPFDLVEMPNWGAEGLCYSLHQRAPLVVRLSTPLAQVSLLKEGRSDRLGLRLACFLEALPARRGACIIAHSEFIANYCIENYRIQDIEKSVIPLGIPAPASSPMKSKVNDKAVTILYVGRLEKRKGIDRLLHAIPPVIRETPFCRFVIAGEDVGEAPQGNSYREYFESFASAAAREATTFLGHVEECKLSQLYADCDVFVAPSLSESFGLIYLEAMACAKPVVAFRTGGVPEVVVHNRNGFLVELDNVSELANALIRLSKDQDLRQTMGRCGFERVQATFPAKRMVEETVACYRRVISGNENGSSHVLE